MEEYDIRRTLRQCKKAAVNGYKLSLKQYKSLKEIIGGAHNG